MRGYSGGLVFFLFSFLILLVSVEADSQIQSSSDATETTVTSELTTTVTSDDCIDLQSSYPIKEVITCTGRSIKINAPPYILDLSRYRDHEVEQLMTDTGTTPTSTRFLKSSLAIKESHLTHLKLDLYLEDANLEFAVISNNELLSIALAGSSKKPLKVTVKGNRKISEETINQMNTLFTKRTQDSYIQRYGECIPKPGRSNIASFDYLKGCKYFKDDLIIDNTTDIENADFPFTEIQGCLMITNTQLTDIRFVNKITSTNCPQGKENLITGNPKICLSSKQKADLKKSLKTVKIENNQKCPDRCTAEWAKENNKTVKCDIIDGDVVIVGVSNAKDLEYLSNVVEIHGRLEVHHNFFTTFSLPKLNKVEHRIIDSPAIFIHDNSNLTSVNLPRLMFLNVHGAKGDLIIIQDNNEALGFDEDEVERLMNLGEGKIRVPRQKPNKITQAPTGNADSTKTTVSPGGAGSKEELEKKEKEAEKKKEESKLGLGLGLGLGLTILGLIVIGVIIGVVVFLVIRKRKRKNKMKKEVKSTATTESAVVEKKKTKEKKEYVVRVEEIPVYPEAKRRMVVDDDGKAADVDDFILLESMEMVYIDQKREHVQRNGRRVASYVREWAFQSKRKVPLKKHANNYPNKILVNKVAYRECTMGVNQDELKKLKIQKCNQYEDIEMFMNVHKTCLSKIEYTENVVEKVVKDFLEKYNHPKQLVKVQAKDYDCRIIGDVNGSIWDLLHVLEKDPAYQKHEHVFCGNYMNGSRHDLHTLLFLFACATHYKFTLLRGTNEYGDRAEEVVKNTLQHYFPESPEETRKSLKNLILQAFEKLPFAALVNERALVVHGGISESWYNGVKNLDEAFDRLEMPLPAEIKPLQAKLISDLLYSESAPVALPIAQCGAGCYFDQIRLKKFLSKMDLDLLVTGRSNTGFDISMNNRLISLSCFFDAEFARCGPEYVFRDRETYEHQIKWHAKNWPFGVLCLSPSGTITMELYRHSYVEENMIEEDDRKPGIQLKYEQDVKTAKATEYNKLKHKMDYGYTENGTKYKGYLAIDKETAQEEEKRRELWHSDFMEGWLANMSVIEAVQHYELLKNDPPELTAITIYGYYKFIVEKGDNLGFMVYQEDDVSPKDPQNLKGTPIFERVVKEMKREEKAKPKVVNVVKKANAKKPKEKKPKGRALRKVNIPKIPEESFSSKVLKEVKIWQLKKASWEEVYDSLSQCANGYEYAVKFFKTEVRKLLLSCNGNAEVVRKDVEFELEDDTYSKADYYDNTKKPWKDRDPKEKKERRGDLLILRHNEKLSTARITKEREQFLE